MTSVGILTDQTKKTPVSEGSLSAPFRFRYGLDRSADSIKVNQPGQDCLAVEWNNNRMVAVLCDGVSQSFFGDLAANFLCESLSAYLLDLPTQYETENLHSKISEYLNSLSNSFSQTIENYSLEHITPVFLRDVLEKKRHLGSEAVFSGLLLDKKSGLAVVIWSGDSRIRIWKQGAEVTQEHFNDTDFLTLERWSSHKGLIGKLHSKILSPFDFDDLVFYSDGLSIADKDSGLFSKDNVEIERLINKTKRSAGSDDISFFQMTSKLQPWWETGNKTDKRHLLFDLDIEKDKFFIKWSDSHSPNSWEIAAVSESDFSIIRTDQTIIKTALDEIPQSGAFFAVRNISQNNYSTWSEWFFFKPPHRENKPPISDTRSEVVKQTVRYTPSQAIYAPPVRQIDPVHSTVPDPEPVHSLLPITPPRPAATISNRKWQFILITLILVTIFLGSFLFIFRKKEPEPKRFTLFFPIFLIDKTLSDIIQSVESNITEEVITFSDNVDRTQSTPSPITQVPNECENSSPIVVPQLYFDNRDSEICFPKTYFNQAFVPISYIQKFLSRDLCSYLE